VGGSGGGAHRSDTDVVDTDATWIRSPLIRERAV
jgi:hypothetical protein